MYLPPTASTPNINGSVPYDYNQSGINSVNSTYWLFNAWYVRLKNASLRYVIPTKFTKKVGIDRLQVYVSGTNILNFYKNKFQYDPELNSN